MIGITSGRLTVLKYIGKEKNGHSRYLCKCECGNEVVIRGTRIRRNITKSCGCLSRDNLINYNKTHGFAGTDLYHAYRRMISRCSNPEDENWERYGGRGIKVCEEWLNDVVCFISWGKENGYRKGLSLERINNDGNYEPSNCRWATDMEQANNRRSNRFEKYRGETHTVAEWCRILNLNPDLIYSRLGKGWAFKRAVETPHIKGRGQYQKYMTEYTKSYAERK